MQIRKAKFDDIGSIENIEKQCFDSQKYPRLSRQNLNHLIKKANAEILVIEQQSTLIASAVVFFRKNSQFARLYSIAVLPEFQGAFYGKALFDQVITNVKQQGLKGLVLEIRADNLKHQKRYLDQGFIVVRALKNYYPDDTDGIKLKKVFV